jgi:colanic acid/amylovoran biosynthesis protein
LRLLIINQHAGNRGDEAAGKALLRALDKEDQIKQVDILYNAVNMLDEEKLSIEADLCITHHSASTLSFSDKILIILSFLLPFWLLRILPKTSDLKSEFKLIENADIVVSAPCGVNMGPYRDWRYLWRLYIAVKLDKPLAIYSISFGPLPKNRLFKSASIYVLRNSKFLSLRDKQSQLYAKEYSAAFVPSIDTVFLDNTFTKELPAEINTIRDGKYVVVVPNELYFWHPYYKKIHPEKIDQVYLNVINLLVNKGLNVVLLPQLYISFNDRRYFERLCRQLPNKEKVCVLSDSYNCDIQQAVINNAEFLVGARCHSIVFAIRGNTPFIALSYEHKMKHMLSLLSLDRYAVDLEEQLWDQNFSDRLAEKIETCLYNRETIKQELSLAKNKANDIAQNTFSAFTEFLRDVTVRNSQKSTF